MFKADPKLIKKRIEALMEREYLERDENDKNVIIYKPWGDRANIVTNLHIHTQEILIIC